MSASSALAYPLRVDSVDSAGRFLEHIWTDSRRQPVWAVFEIGSDLSYEPLRSSCIRRQADELRNWVATFETMSYGYAVPGLRALARSVSTNNFIPASNIAINWRGYHFPHNDGEVQRMKMASKHRMYLQSWEQMSFNNVVLTVTPSPTNDYRNCDIATQAELEQFFKLMFDCVSTYGANCRPLP